MNTNLSENLIGQPYIFNLINNASLIIARDIRDEFVNLTDKITSNIREISKNNMTDFRISSVDPPHWKDLRGEIVSFIDGGVGFLEIFHKIPLIIRSGIFKIITGEYEINKREKFKIFPCFIGDFEDVKKDSNDYISVGRIIIELLAAYNVLYDEEFNDTDILILHGPLVHRMSQYSPQYIGEKDIRKIISSSFFNKNKYLADIIKNFRIKCNTCPIRNQISNWCSEYERQNRISAVCFIKFLLEEIFTKSKESHKPLIFGAVERSKMTEYTKKVIFPLLYQYNRNFLHLFNISPSNNLKKDLIKFLEKTSYHDALLLSLILNEGEYTQPKIAEDIFTGFKQKFKDMDKILKKKLGIKYIYLKVKQNTFPIRLEFPSFLSTGEINKIINNAYLYSKLLPNYAFPIGLDIVDKFAKIPSWMVESFKKLIMLRLNIEANNEIEKIFCKIMNLILLQRRDWQFRPKI